MPHITSAQAAKILGISKRTLHRWEIEGRIRFTRQGILATRVFDKDYVEMAKNILDLDKLEEEHLKKLPQIRNNVKEHYLEQEYIPGKPLKLSTTEDVEAAMKAFDAEEAWLKEHKRLLSELLSYPRDILRELLLEKE